MNALTFTRRLARHKAIVHLWVFRSKRQYSKTASHPRNIHTNDASGMFLRSYQPKDPYSSSTARKQRSWQARHRGIAGLAFDCIYPCRLRILGTSFFRIASLEYESHKDKLRLTSFALTYEFRVALKQYQRALLHPETHTSWVSYEFILR